MATSLLNPAAASVKKPIARVLVVEDDAEIANLMQLALSRSLIDATLCHTGEEALTRLAAEDYDLLLLDIALPGISGLEVCRLVKANPQFQDIPVLIVSGQGSPENKQEAERLGAVEFIEKPVTLLRFLSRVMGHLKLKENREGDVRQLLPVAAH